MGDEVVEALSTRVEEQHNLIEALSKTLADAEQSRKESHEELVKMMAQFMAQKNENSER